MRCHVPGKEDSDGGSGVRGRPTSPPGRPPWPTRLWWTWPFPRSEATSPRTGRCCCISPPNVLLPCTERLSQPEWDCLWHQLRDQAATREMQRGPRAGGEETEQDLEGTGRWSKRGGEGRGRGTEKQWLPLHLQRNPGGSRCQGIGWLWDSIGRPSGDPRGPLVLQSPLCPARGGLAAGGSMGLHRRHRRERKMDVSPRTVAVTGCGREGEVTLAPLSPDPGTRCLLGWEQ